MLKHEKMYALEAIIKKLGNVITELEDYNTENINNELDDIPYCLDMQKSRIKKYLKEKVDEWDI